MALRSLLFVPGDRPDRFPKALASAADALILDLEDSVSLAKKQDAREAVADFLGQPREKPLIVRVNPLDTDLIDDDLRAIESHKPDAIMLPKAEGGGDIEILISLLGESAVPVLPIATETATSVFNLSTYSSVSDKLFGMTWGAEDLPAAIGALTSREEDGTLTPVYQWVRAQVLFAAHAAETVAIETVYPNIKDLDGLAAYAARGRRDGFTAMMAIHPAQCEIINAAFTPSDAEVEHAKKIIAAFEQDPSAGVLNIDGKMVDRPHLILAKKVLQRIDGE